MSGGDWEVSDYGLEKAICESKPEIAASVALRLLEQTDLAGLGRVLIRTAAKNDGGICLGHDLKLCSHVLADYPRMHIPQRNKILKALAYFLAEIEKDYDFYNAFSIH
jgi:hypothetical protein